MFCSKCGFQFEGKFCPQCGQPAVSDTAGGVPVQRLSTPQVDFVPPTSCQTTSPIVAGPTIYPSAGAAPAHNAKPQASMQTGKLVIGILSVILSLWVFLQALVVGALSSLANMDTTGGAAGILLSLCWLVAGIIGIAGRKSRPASWVGCAVYAFGAIVAFGNGVVSNFTDLIIYAVTSGILAILFGVSAIVSQK